MMDGFGGFGARPILKPEPKRFLKKVKKVGTVHPYFELGWLWHPYQRFSRTPAPAPQAFFSHFLSNLSRYFFSYFYSYLLKFGRLKERIMIFLENGHFPIPLRVLSSSPVIPFFPLNQGNPANTLLFQTIG